MNSTMLFTLLFTFFVMETVASCNPNCNLRPDPGPCRAAFTRYYWDGKAGDCKPFTYGGCQGTVPFKDEMECWMADCPDTAEPAEPEPVKPVCPKCPAVQCPPVRKCPKQICPKIHCRVRPCPMVRCPVRRCPKPSCPKPRCPPPPPPPPPPPLPKPCPPLKPSGCHQKGCVSYDGKGDYKVIGNSMSYSEDRRNCRLKPSSSALLKIPKGAKIKKAILYWSGAGRWRRAESTVTMNGHKIATRKISHGGYRHYRFYGAQADVTNYIKGSGQVKVSNIWAFNRGILCSGNAAYAAWSLIVVYAHRSLPKSRVNVCTENFRFTFPAGNYYSHVGCLVPNKHTTADTTVVSFEGDAYKGEWFYINNHRLGNNLFRGTRAPNLDILSWPVGRYIRRGAHRITYRFKTYYVRSRFGGAIEGLFMPIRVVKQTL